MFSLALLSKLLLGMLVLVALATTGLAAMPRRSSGTPVLPPPSPTAAWADPPAAPPAGGAGDSDATDPQPHAWLDDAEYARRRAPYLAGVPAAEQICTTRPAWGLLIRAIAPDAPQAAALDLQAGDLLLMQDDQPLMQSSDLTAVNHARTLTVLRPSSGQRREVVVAPGPIGIIAGPDWRPELPLLAGDKRSDARDDLYVACLAREGDRQLAETALVHASAAHLTREPYWSVFAQLLLDTGRYGGAIRAVHNAAATTDFDQMPPLCRIWTTACLAGARYDEADHPPPRMALRVPAHPIHLGASERVERLPSLAAAGRSGPGARRLALEPDGGPVEQGLARRDGAHGGAWSWNNQPWHYIVSTPLLPARDQVVQFALELPKPTAGYPALRVGFLDQDPTDQNFFTLNAGHPLIEPIDVILHAAGYCELGARGLEVVTLHPAAMTVGMGHPMQIALWWFHDWWEFDLDGVPMAYGPALEPVQHPLRVFLESFSGSGRITDFECRDLGGPAAQPHAAGF